MSTTSIMYANPGESIYNAIKRFLNKDELSTLQFNDILLVKRRGDTQQSLETQYFDKGEKARIEYINSPQYKEQQIKARIKRYQETIEASQLMLEFPSVDLSSKYDVVNWLYKLIPYTDTKDSCVDTQWVVGTLLDAGYVQNANIGDACKPDDVDNVALYLIGQMLDMLIQWRAIDGNFQGMVLRWKEQFNK